MIEFKKHPDFPIPLPSTRIGALEALDKYFPSITDRINIDRLRMNHSIFCVLGQTIGYDNHIYMFDFHENNFANYSFSSGDDEWKQAILDYRARKPKFNLKTQPWFIKTDTPEERIAAQKWLFEQGMEWEFYGNKLSQFSGIHCLTNTRTAGDIKPFIMCGEESHESCQEIKLTYKTTVTDVQWPNPNKAKAEKLRAKIARLEAKLKELESACWYPNYLRGNEMIADSRMTQLTDDQLKAAYNAPNGGHLGGLRAVADAVLAAERAGVGEPVAWRRPSISKKVMIFGYKKDRDFALQGWEPLYAHPVHDIGKTVVPEGYALVPIKPTKEMLDSAVDMAGKGLQYHNALGRIITAWDTMMEKAQ